MLNVTAGEIARMLAERAEEVCSMLLPKGKRKGNEWHAGNIHGHPGDSLRVSLAGDKAGLWSDFADPKYSGDLLDLWAATMAMELREAIKEAKAFLGINDPVSSASSMISTTRREPEYSRPEKPKCTKITEDSVAGQYLTGERGLLMSTLEAYRIAENGREMIFPYLRGSDLIQVKYLGLERPEGKKQIRTEANCEPCLFGWQVISPSARRVMIAEGEIDAMSWYQMGYPCLSLPFGAGDGKGKHKWIETEWERLECMDEILLSFDMDDEGIAAANHVIERLGTHRCRIVSLPFKDANKCLTEMVLPETMAHYVNTAQSVDPEELRSAKDFTAQVIEQFWPEDGEEPGLKIYWRPNKEYIIFRPAEVTIWYGVNGHGKSMLQSLINIIGMCDGHKFCVASMELPPPRFLKRAMKQISGMDRPSEQYIEAMGDWLHGKMWLFNVRGTARADRLLEVFLYAKRRYGINHFVIDSLAKCGFAEDDYNAQKDFVDKLTDFAYDNHVHVHLVCHSRKGNDEHEMRGKMDVKGTGAITDMVDNTILVWRNKRKEARLVEYTESIEYLESMDPKAMSDDERKELDDLREKLEKAENTCDAKLMQDKNRNGDWEGTVKLFFDINTFQYRTFKDDKPIAYYEFSSIEAWKERFPDAFS